MVLGMLLEMLGLSLVIPVLAIISQSDLAYQYPFLKPLLQYLGNPSTYEFFPGDRLIHYDFLTGQVSPDSEKPIGENYPTLQIHLFDKVHNRINGETLEKVPYFSVYPSSDLWMDIIKVE